MQDIRVLCGRRGVDIPESLHDSFALAIYEGEIDSGLFNSKLLTLPASFAWQITVILQRDLMDWCRL